MYQISLIKVLEEITNEINLLFNNKIVVKHHTSSDFCHHYYYLIEKIPRKIWFPKNDHLIEIFAPLEDQINSCIIYNEVIWKKTIKKLSNLPKANIFCCITFKIGFVPTKALKNKLREDKKFKNYRIEYIEK